MVDKTYTSSSGDGGKRLLSRNHGSIGRATGAHMSEECKVAKS
jgi:hypothetical protein